MNRQCVGRCVKSASVSSVPPNHAFNSVIFWCGRANILIYKGFSGGSLKKKTGIRPDAPCHLPENIHIAFVRKGYPPPARLGPDGSNPLPDDDATTGCRRDGIARAGLQS